MVRTDTPWPIIELQIHRTVFLSNSIIFIQSKVRHKMFPSDNASENLASE